MSSFISFPNAYGTSKTYVVDIDNIAYFRKKKTDTHSTEKKDLGETTYSIYFQLKFPSGGYSLTLDFWNEDNRDNAYDSIYKALVHSTREHGDEAFVEITTRVHPKHLKDE